MSRFQFWILNLASLLLVGLLWGTFYLNKENDRLRADINPNREKVQQARQLEPVLEQLARRIATGSDANPEFRELLAKHGLKVTLDVDGQQRTYP